MKKRKRKMPLPASPVSYSMDYRKPPLLQIEIGVDTTGKSLDEIEHEINVWVHRIRELKALVEDCK